MRDWPLPAWCLLCMNRFSAFWGLVSNRECWGHLISHTITHLQEESTIWSCLFLSKVIDAEFASVGPAGANIGIVLANYLFYYAANLLYPEKNYPTFCHQIREAIITTGEHSFKAQGFHKGCIWYAWKTMRWNFNSSYRKERRFCRPKQSKVNCNVLSQPIKWHYQFPLLNWWLKALDTFGNCQRPVFLLGVPTYA